MRNPAALAVALIAGCARIDPPVVSSPPLVASSGARDPAPLPPAASTDKPATEPTPSDSPPERDEIDLRWRTVYPDASAVETKGWVAAHGVKGKAPAGPCWDARGHAGVPPTAALVCLVTQGPVPRITAVLLRLDHQRLVEVWKGLVQAWANWLDLTPVLADDGATLTLHDAGDCKGAAGESRGKDSVGVGVPGLTKTLVEACAALGSYQWNGRRYVRAKP